MWLSAAFLLLILVLAAMVSVLRVWWNERRPTGNAGEERSPEASAAPGDPQDTGRDGADSSSSPSSSPSPRRSLSRPETDPVSTEVVPSAADRLSGDSPLLDISPMDMDVVAQSPDQTYRVAVAGGTSDHPYGTVALEKEGDVCWEEPLYRPHNPSVAADGTVVVEDWGEPLADRPTSGLVVIGSSGDRQFAYAFDANAYDSGFAPPSPDGSPGLVWLATAAAPTDDGNRLFVYDVPTGDRQLAAALPFQDSVSVCPSEEGIDVTIGDVTARYRGSTLVNSAQMQWVREERRMGRARTPLTLAAVARDRLDRALALPLSELSRPSPSDLHEQVQSSSSPPEAPSQDPSSQESSTQETPSQETAPQESPFQGNPSQDIASEGEDSVEEEALADGSPSEPGDPEHLPTLHGQAGECPLTRAHLRYTADQLASFSGDGSDGAKGRLYYRLGQIRGALGQKQRAETAYERAASLAGIGPDHSPAPTPS
jgi:hypothetical protein